MIYARLTDGKSFAQPIKFSSPESLKRAVTQFYEERNCSRFSAQRWLNEQLTDIDKWEQEKLLNKANYLDRFSIEQQAKSWRAKAKRGNRHGRDHYLMSVELHVFDQYCGLSFERMIDKSEAFLSIADYCQIPRQAVSDTDGNISVTGKMKDAHSGGNVCLVAVEQLASRYSHYINEASTDWAGIYNQCCNADEHARALSMFCKNLSKMGTPTPEERRSEFKIIDGDML